MLRIHRILKALGTFYIFESYLSGCFVLINLVIIGSSWRTKNNSKNKIVQEEQSISRTHSMLLLFPFLLFFLLHKSDKL